jgi:uncharacterized protein (DUF2141 family)
MKLYVLLATILSLNLHTHDLSIVIENIHNSNGNIMIALHKQSKDFPNENSAVVLRTLTKAKEGSLIYSISNLQKESYAIALYHDENSNLQLDKNIFGIPKEGYGFSNNAKGFMGPPSFKESEFLLDKSKQINIKVSYK